MDSDSSSQFPKRLTTLASNVKYSDGNLLLHQFVLDNSYPNNSGSETYIHAVLSSMSDTSVNAVNDEGRSALHLAVCHNNILMVRKLLSCLGNLNVNARIYHGGPFEETVLHLATRLGHLSIVAELLDNGADAKAKGFYSSSPLHAACGVSGDNSDIVRLLLERGADINAQDIHLETPLHYACRVEWGNPGIVKFLLDSGADINTENIDCETPLHNACRVYWAKPDIVKLLLERGAGVNAKTVDCKTPLHSACEVDGDNSDIVKLLLESGADINAENVDHETPLHNAYQVNGNESDIVKVLLERGAKQVKWG